MPIDSTCFSAFDIIEIIHFILSEEEEFYLKSKKKNRRTFYIVFIRQIKEFNNMHVDFQFRRVDFDLVDFRTDFLWRIIELNWQCRMKTFRRKDAINVRSKGLFSLATISSSPLLFTPSDLKPVKWKKI